MADTLTPEAGAAAVPVAVSAPAAEQNPLAVATSIASNEVNTVPINASVPVPADAMLGLPLATAMPGTTSSLQSNDPQLMQKLEEMNAKLDLVVSAAATAKAQTGDQICAPTLMMPTVPGPIPETFLSHNVSIAPSAAHAVAPGGPN